MIITSRRELEVGKIYNQNNFDNFRYGIEHKHEFCFLVMRVATRNEYHDFVKKEFPGVDDARIQYWNYFYLVSLD